MNSSTYNGKTIWTKADGSIHSISPSVSSYYESIISNNLHGSVTNNNQWQMSSNAWSSSPDVLTEEELCEICEKVKTIRSEKICDSCMDKIKKHLPEIQNKFKIIDKLEKL